MRQPVFTPDKGLQQPHYLGSGRVVGKREDDDPGVVGGRIASDIGEVEVPCEQGLLVAVSVRRYDIVGGSPQSNVADVYREMPHFL
jgi:hypothetical protein